MQDCQQDAQPPNGISFDRSPLHDPKLEGFSNSFFPGAVAVRVKAPKLELHSLPELALFADWETTLLMAPASLQSTKTSFHVYSAQYSKILARFAWYLESMKQHAVNLRMQN